LPTGELMTDPPSDQIITATLEVARRLMRMEVAHLSRFIYGYQQVEAVGGDADTFGLEAGMRVPLVDTICRQMVMQRVPRRVPDTRAEPTIANLPGVGDDGVGAYVGVPVSAPDGTLFGTLCCLSDRPRPDISDEDVGLLETLSVLLGDHLQRVSHRDGALAPLRRSGGA
jgi:GAF domain-containing protein